MVSMCPALPEDLRLVGKVHQKRMLQVIHEQQRGKRYPHRQRFSAVRLWLDADSRVSTGSMFSFLVPTRFSDRLTTLRPDTSSRLSSDCKNAPMSSAAIFFTTRVRGFVPKERGRVDLN